ncbi:MAG: hypothetical protein H0X31_00135 [Nostocaceae cyanobacterium]|nr:hypothetical protein [Nostocaceae cyanobacterium]
MPLRSLSSDAIGPCLTLQADRKINQVIAVKNLKQAIAPVNNKENSYL